MVTLSEDPQSQNGECVDVVKISVLFTQMKEKEFYGNIYKAGQIGRASCRERV